MLLKKISIGGLKTPCNVFLAPLAGYSNAPFRELCSLSGAGLTFTEMVSAKGLCYDSAKTRGLLAVPEHANGIKACQIFGHEPEYIRRAAESEDLSVFDLIDINMGCPVPKIYKNGDGCALMNDLKLSSKIISACKKSGKAVSVKFRTGIVRDKIIAEQFAAMCEDSGADMITVHGRTRDMMYSGAVDFKAIAAAKAAVSIPVIANGGIFTKEDADIIMAETGADGVMIARGALYNPWIFSEITGTPPQDKLGSVMKQLAETEELYGERFALVYMRKMMAFYLKGKRGATALRQKLLQVGSIAELKEMALSLGF